MTTRRFEVSGGDDDMYGSAFGPVLAEEIREIRYLSRPALLLQPLTPFIIKDEKVEYLFITSRWVEQTLDEIREKGGTVAVGLVAPDDIDNEEKLNNGSVLAIGSCFPV